MKKVIAIALASQLLVSACGTQTSAPIPQNSVEQSNPSGTSVQPDQDNLQVGTQESSESKDIPSSSAESFYEINLDGITTLEQLEDKLKADLNNSIESLNTRWKSLSSETDSYEKYTKNADKVSAFYETIVSETNKMCIMLMEYSAAYARMVLDSDLSDEKKYKAIDGINDEIYDDACDEINDEIYDSLLDEMNKFYYQDVLDKTPDGVEYSDWYETISKEYEQWYDTASDVYGLYYDTASDIYSFYYDMSSALYSGNSERAEKRYEQFVNKIAKAKGQEKNSTTNTDASFDTTVRNASNPEELEKVIDAHLSECIQALKNDWTSLSTNVDTFEKYKNNESTVDAFHTQVEDSTDQILAMICDYGVSYANLILDSNSSAKEMYNAFEDFLDCIYEDSCEMVKDEIYEDLLEDVKDYYYDGIIKDGKDSVAYSDWSNTRSDAYSRWSDTRSNVYRSWSDTRSTIYKFYSEIRSELYSGDIEDAREELQQFQKKVEKMK